MADQERRPPAVRQPATSSIARAAALYNAASRPRPSTSLAATPNPRLVELAQRGSRGRSLTQQITDPVVGLPAGLFGLAGQALRSAAGFPQAFVDIGRMAVDDDYRPVSDTQDFGTVAQHYFPLLETFRQSGSGTIHRLANPSEYGRAVREGRIVDALLEDLGNVSLVGLAGGRALTAAGSRTGSAGLTATGRRLTDVARMGDRGGAAPAMPYVYAARGLRPLARLVDNVVESRTGRPLSETARRFVRERVFEAGPPDARSGLIRQAMEPARRAVAASRLNPTVRAAARDLDTARLEIDTSALPAIEAMMDLERLRPDVVDAANIVRQGLGQQWRAAADLPDAAFRRFVEEADFGGSGTATPEALRLAIDYERGVLPGELRAQMDEARRIIDEVAERRTAGALADPTETGREFALDPEQLGNRPLSSVIDAELRRRLGLRRSALSPEDAIERRRAEAARLTERAQVERARADAVRAQSRPIREPESVRQVLRRGEQIGRSRQRLSDARRTVDQLRRRLDEAVERLVEDDATGLNERAAAVERLTDEYNAAVDTLNSAARRSEIASTPRLSQDLGAARQAVRQARRDLRRAEADLGRAIGRQQSPNALSRAVEQAAARLDEAQARVDALTREVDAVSNLFLPEQGPTLRGTFSRGERAGRLEARARSAEARAGRAVRKAARFEEKVGRLTDEIARSAEAAPARFRRNIRAAERGVKALQELADEFPEHADLLAQVADEVPKTLDELVEAGIDPAHLIGGRVQPRTMRSLGQTRQRLPREGRTTTTRQAQGDVVEFSARNQMIQEAAEARRLAGRRAAQEFDAKYAVNAADVIPPSQLEGLTGAALREAMAEFGYEAWNPRTILDIVPDAQITPETRFLPKALKDAFTYTIDTSLPNAAWDLLARGNQKFKNALLPLSPTWYMGNTVGNALMAIIGEGMNPLEYTARLVDEWRNLRATGTQRMPRRATTTGLSFQEGQVLSVDRLTRRAPRFYGRFRDAAYNFVSEWLDDANKAVVYNHALEQARSNPALRGRLKDIAVDDARRALADAELAVSRYAPDDVPDAVLAKVERARENLRRTEASDAPFVPEEYALRQALDVMGDYARMAPFERKLVQVIPFYRWVRHITALSLRLPFEHPARVTWALHLANLFDPGDENMPGFLKGALPLGGGWLLPSRSLNPFGDIGAEGGGPLLNFEEFLRSTSPFIKVPFAALTGRNLGRGGDPLSRPYGSGVIDPDTGREDASPALVSLFPQNTRWGELAHFASSQLPVARNLRDLVTGQAGVARYDTGDPVLRRGRPVRNESIYGPLAPLAQLANLPRAVSPRDAAAARQRFVENLRRARRTQQAYRSGR